MNTDSTNQIQLTKNEGGSPIFISADSRWVYYRSGVNETLWRVSADGGEETQISTSRTWNPAFSPDGKYFAYFFRNEADHLLQIPVESVETKSRVGTFPLAADTFAQGRIAWLNDNKSFYYITTNGSQSMLWYQSIDGTKAPKHVADLGAEEVSDFVLAPDDNNTFALISGRWIYEAVLIQA